MLARVAGVAGFGQQEQKLVAAQAGHGIALAELVFQPVRR